MPPLFGVLIGTWHGDQHRVKVAIGGEKVKLSPDEAEAVAAEIEKKADRARRASRRAV